jgi:hypothetical protein
LFQGQTYSSPLSIDRCWYIDRMQMHGPDKLKSIDRKIANSIPGNESGNRLRSDSEPDTLRLDVDPVDQYLKDLRQLAKVKSHQSHCGGTTAIAQLIQLRRDKTDPGKQPTQSASVRHDLRKRSENQFLQLIGPYAGGPELLVHSPLHHCRNVIPAHTHRIALEASVHPSPTAVEDKSSENVFGPVRPATLAFVQDRLRLRPD